MSNGYKVVKLIDSKYYSASTHGIGVVEYAIGVSAEPAEGCGPLTAFTSYDTAVDWIEDKVNINDREHFALFKCTYTETSENQVFVNSSDGITANLTTDKSKCPTGTVLASEITLVKLTSWNQ
jgi:hypothetical protein